MNYLAIFLLVFMIGISKGAVIYVSPSDDLWSAYFYANPGDTLLLADGTYMPDAQAEDSALVIDKDITFRAQNAGYAVIDGKKTKRIFLIHTGQVVLDGLNITNGRAHMGAGALIQGGDVLIKFCYVFNNTLSADDYGGGVLVQNGTVRFESTNVFNNVANFHGSGVDMNRRTFENGTISFDDFTGIHDNSVTNCVGFTDPACGRAGPPFPPHRMTKYVCHITAYQCVEDSTGDFSSHDDCTAKCVPPTE